MVNAVNLSSKIKKQLPADLVSFMQMAGEAAVRERQRLFLVGGAVRDLLLERDNLDLDLVAEGDAIQLAQEIAQLKHGKVIAHSRFNTAKIRWDRWSVDIATTRGETYDRPGALPTVCCGGDIEGDLIRRDFTINAMAVYLEPSRFGELIDVYNGRDDLKRGYIRILHDNSFKDDATRIWRAVRYEKRLGFSIEHHTLALLKQDVAYLDTISSDRIRHELELVLEEEQPEKALLRAGELGLLSRICPALEADDWLVKKIGKARSILQPYSPPEELYLAFLIYQLAPGDLAVFINYLKLPRTITKTLQDTLKLKGDLGCLEGSEPAPSRIYRCLQPYSLNAILANLMTAGSPVIRQRIKLYMNRLRHIQPSLTGEDLIKIGLASGPRIKEVLDLLREAKLDGRAGTREAELEIVRNLSLSS
jgi:tRNA nucleotidyltransferase (CCA-adding enzyme)